jgi:hypothetical protein
MTTPRLLPIALSFTVTLLLGIAPAFGLLPFAPPRTADAFNPPVHKAIFEQALADKFSPEARDWVKAGLEQSDRPFGHFYAQLHFDSALNREQVCQRVNDGPRSLLSRAAEAAIEAPTDPLPRSRIAALTLFGQYIHAIEDFYTHSNWIELHIAKGEKPETLPILTEQGACNPVSLPEELTTGYFSPWYGFDGCPDAGPPGAFTYCHGPTADPTRQLAKDVPNEFHGADKLPGGTAICPENPCTRTYHDEAKRLATDATRESWPTFKATIEAAMQRTFPDRDATCLFTWLVQGGDPACPLHSELRFRLDGVPTDPAAARQLEEWMGGLLLAQRGDEVEVLDYHAELRLDPGKGPSEQGGTGGILGGAFSGTAVNQTQLTDPNRHWIFGPTHVEFESTGISQPTTDNAFWFKESWFQGGVGLIQFEMVVSTRRESGMPMTPSEQIELMEFGLALDENGALVLCRTDRVDRTNPERTRGGCLSYPLWVLPRVT